MAARRANPLLLALGVLLAAGCGLGDYERRMEEERTRLEAFDQEDRALAGPLVMPQSPYDANEPKDHPLPQSKVFLRPPRGFSTHPADDEKPTRSGDVFLFRYPGPAGYNLFLAGVPPDTLTTEQFQQHVRKALSEYVANLTKQPLTIPPDAPVAGVVKQPVVSRTAKVPPIRLDWQSVDDAEPGEKGSRYLIYFLREAGNRQLAVIFQVPKAAAGTPQVTEAIDLSLRTLGIGANAELQRKAFDERKLYFPSLR